MHRLSFRPLLLGTAVALATVGLAVPGAASAAGSGEGAPARLERACLRIPNLQLRTDNAIARLNGDATTRGSLAWLQAKIDLAESRGRTEAVTVLENRLAVRTETLEVLELRRTELVDLAARCAARGLGQ